MSEATAHQITTQATRDNPGDLSTLYRHIHAHRPHGLAQLAEPHETGFGPDSPPDARFGRHLATLASVGYHPLDARRSSATTALNRARRLGQSHELPTSVITSGGESGLGWDDVVLPKDTLATLHEIVAYAQNRATVFADPHYAHLVPYGRGLSCLFAGPPGTGKTMMAGVLANALGLELYRVDISRVTSKWLGETEKRLGQLFDEAERAGAILFFDEADSLFAKRTDVKGSNDRYANMEVNFLLQRMESYDGMSILATNLQQSLDAAFKRRMRFTVHFELPDATHRATLWRKMVPPVVPEHSPVDFAALGKRFRFTGALIKNAVIRAAFGAAEAKQPLTERRLFNAAKAELAAQGRLG